MLDQLQPQGDFANIEGLEGSFADPMFNHIRADTDATDEEEMVVGVAMEEVGRVLYDESGASDIAQMLASDERPLYEALPEIAVPILTKAYQVVQEVGEGDEIPDAMFGEGGVITQVVDALFQIADASGRPDAADPDQYSATLIGVYNKVGEHIDETGDEAAKAQVAELGMNMAMTNPDGTMNNPDAVKDPQLSKMASGVAQGLYGPQGGVPSGDQGGLLG